MIAPRIQLSEWSAGPTVREVRRATRAVYVVFFASGLAMATWASRIPQIRDRLGVGPAELGLILLSLALGSIVALPLAGMVVSHFGAARTIAGMSLILAVGLATTAIGYRNGVAPVVVGLLLFGVGNGTWDVAMNVQGAAVERQLGRAILPKFHAGFSIGTVIGALVGAAMVALGVTATAQLLVVAVIIAISVPLAVRGFIPPQPAADRPAGESARGAMRAWTEPRTILLGVFVLCMAFTEGTGNDWLGIAMIDGYRAPAALGTLTFAVFVAAMTTGRWFGPALIDRYGRVAVLRGAALTAFAGLLLVVYSGTLATAMIGAALWGLGAALGFPVGMSAASDEPRHAPGRVSVVASIGYTAFLAGPPLIGFLGNHVGVLHSLTVAAGLLAVATAIAGACREPMPAGTKSS